MALPATRIQATLTQADKAPLGSVKWKALYDADNSVTNKILFCNTHTSDLMPWSGFVRHRSKDYIYTYVPHTNEQHHTIINTIETQVSQILSQHEWSRSFKLMTTQKIYPKAEDCIFYEKREDGQLYPVKPDIEGELHNTPEKSLSIGAVLQVTGVFFDFATHTAKLTFKLVSATYAWAITAMVHEEVLAKYLAVFGPIASKDQQPAQAVNMDIVEAAASVAGISVMPPPSSETPLDKESFLASLSKLRTVGGIQRKMRQLQKRQMESGFREWCEQEARRAMFALSAKDAEKKRRKAEEEEAATAAVKKVKPFTLQRQNNMNNFKVVLEEADPIGGTLISTDDEEEDMDEDGVLE